MHQKTQTQTQTLSTGMNVNNQDTRPDPTRADSHDCCCVRNGKQASKQARSASLLLTVYVRTYIHTYVQYCPREVKGWRFCLRVV